MKKTAFRIILSIIYVSFFTVLYGETAKHRVIILTDIENEPVAALGKDRSNHIIRMKVMPGKTIKLDASKSSDPDGNQLSFNWFFYKNASSYTGAILPENGKSPVLNLKVPDDLGINDIHLILDVCDNGTPSLVSYRRIIISK